MQRSDDIDRAASNSARHAVNFAELMVQGSARMFEIQAAAARTFCQYQAKSAAMTEGLEQSKRMTEQAAERAAQEAKRAKHA